MVDSQAFPIAWDTLRPLRDGIIDDYDVLLTGGMTALGSPDGFLLTKATFENFGITWLQISPRSRQAPLMPAPAWALSPPGAWGWASCHRGDG